MIHASQAEICYWVTYSLCGTKAGPKVFKSLDTRCLPLTQPYAFLQDAVKVDLVASDLGKRSGSQSGYGTAEGLRCDLLRHISADPSEQTFLRKE